MRRTIVTAVTAVALAVPSVALAQHDGQAHENHHRGAHRERHHRHAHVLRFGAVASVAPSTTPAQSAPASSDETAGKIASFTNGTLTITLNDGSTVSGKVDESTEIECGTAMASAASDGHGDHGRGGDGEGSGPSSSGDDQQAEGQQGDDQQGDRGDDPQGGAAGHDEGDDGGQGEKASRCTSAALVPGAVVREAELRVSSAGAVWGRVELSQ